MGVKVLLIAYDFPPSTVPRSIRWANLSSCLIKKGYTVDVFTIKMNKGYKNIDIDRLGLVPNAARVICTYPGPLHGLSYPNKIRGKHVVTKGLSIPLISLCTKKIRSFAEKILRKIYNDILMPDNAVEWLPWALPRLWKLRKNNYNVVISSAKPFTAHILGYCFKKWAKVSWISDYGDPWVFNPLHSKMRYYIDKYVESSLLKNVDQIIVTTNETKNGFVKYYPFINAKKIHILTQGYNRQIYQKIEPERSDKFRIVYTGGFYKNFREPYIFFDVIKDLEDIELEAMIAGSNQEKYASWVLEKKLNKKIIFLGPLPYQKSVALQKGADVLLLLGNPGGYQLPGKIFEYFGACKPILHIKNDDADIASHYVKKYNRGIVVQNSKISITNAIRTLHNLKKKNSLKRHFSFSVINEYAWESLSEKLDNIIQSVT